MGYQLLLLTLLCATGSAIAAFCGAVWLGSRMAPTGPATADETGPDETWFEFRRGELADASGPAREYLSMLAGDAWSGPALIDHLSRSFPDLRAAMLQAARTGRETPTSFDRSRSARIECRGGLTRLTIMTAETDLVTMDRGSHASLNAELTTLRAMGDKLAYPAWRQTREGTVIWANRAYLDLAGSAVSGKTAKWPPPVVFRDLALDDTGPDGARVALDMGDDGVVWFECHVRPLDGDVFVTAAPADALIHAERTLGEFTQTFSQTFAHLTVGIAVFGRDRELVMFNPALTDLTTLPVDMLLGQPRLDVFLDALRARQLLPEPKDQTAWLDRVDAVERTSQEGSYAEMWHLPGGRTYRITGRPQIGGAFALLIEDISAEISLTRRFRSEIDTGHAILNAIPDALAVFDRAGHLVQTNAAYDALWDCQDAGALSHLRAGDAVRLWDGASTAGPEWAAVQAYLTQDLPAQGWSTDIHLLDGRAMCLSIAPLDGGMRLVRFAQMTRPPSSRLVKSETQNRVERLLKA